ncbi:MAG: DMT family transporter, partial [Deltaproteobacteria bacterium]|nr:DMT family transporter [Deltaproteobacteria bacterium]
FVFLRIVAPALGPIVTADLRVLIAWAALQLYFRAIGLDVHWRRFWRQYVVIGIFNGALPFFLFAFAALHIPASYSAILNATSPLFGALFSAFWLGEKITAQKILGFFLGLAGVALVTRLGSGAIGTMALWAIAACLGAACCYGISSTYAKGFAGGANPKAIAGASQLAAGLLLLPLIPLAPPPGPITVNIALSMLTFALLCSGWAFLLYFRLITDVGATKALTVTFLMPAFTMIWSALFLGERVTAETILGCVLVLCGTGLVVRRGKG